MLFQLHGDAYALGIGAVMEVLPMVALARVPGSFAALEGLVDLRGRVIPVLDARRLLGLPERQPDLHTPILIVRKQERVFGLIVDLVTEVRTIPLETLTPPDLLAGPAHGIAAVARLDNRIVLLLNLDSLCADLPTAGAAMSAIEQR
ncbi:MAG TPA: chemotaxis protein CheW [Anaerolineae bacterium]